jgi:S1-C subfamily serine protease
MLGSVLLDLVIIAILIAYLIYGYRTGLIRALAGVIGVVVGGFLAVLLVPIVSAWVSDPTLRTFATIATVVILVIGCYYGGASLGILIQSRMKGRGLRGVDRAFGAVLTTIIAALVVSMLATSISALGIPAASQAIASSAVLRGINDITPDPVQAFLAQVRSATVDQSLPRIAQAFGGTGSASIPDVNTDTPVLNNAAQSVVRITGNAYACGQSQSGTGWVVAHDRIITNAHVVAGVSHPVVDVRNGPALQSTVVYFDPTGDLAVLAVPGLDLKTLTLGSTATSGTHGIGDGYPFGGPFDSYAAGIDNVGTINVENIYNSSTNPREIYSLAANVQEGDSGGPLMTTSGTVIGIVFAKGATTPNVGYAITMKSVAPVAAKAASLTAGVSSGACVKG